MNKTQTGTTESEAIIAGTKSIYEQEQALLQKKMDDYTLYNGAVDSMDLTACEKIVGNDILKAECLDNVNAAKASKGKDVTLCDKILDTERKNHCTSSFAYDTALASSKQSDCDKITGDSDLKNACTKNIIFAKIESQSFSGTTDVCDSLLGADKDYCVNRIKKSSDIELLQKGTNTKDLNICSQIQDTGMKNICNDMVYMTLALEKKDGTLCTKIVDTARKTTCTTQFARINDAALFSKALAANDLALCATITTPELKTKCSDNIFLKTGLASRDAAICAKISDVGTQKQCSDAVKLILENMNKQK